MLESLLDLSRALTVELTQGEMMDRICETLWHLIDGQSTATAIMIRSENRLNVRCHFGFGSDGLKEDHVPFENSLASLVLNATGEHVLHDVLGLHYVLARIIVAVTVSVCWNFTMHRAKNKATHGARGRV